MATCPRCRPKCDLESRSLKGFDVEICGQCRGIAVGRRDVEALLALSQIDSPEPKTASTPDYFDQLKKGAEFVDDKASLTCPNCSYQMYDVNSGNIVIDFCMSCQCIWFDRGELKQALKRAREEGAVPLIPTDLDENITAELMAWMLTKLDTTTPE